MPLSSDAEIAKALLLELQQHDITLFLENDSLRFNAPKGALTDALRERLKASKPALIELLAAQKQESDSIPVQPRSKGLPLSTAQQRFWFLDRLDQGNSAAFVMPPIVLKITGDLDIAALEKALNALVQRHEVLRSVFTLENDEPVQTALANVGVELPIIDLSKHPVDQVDQEVQAFVKKEALTPFDLVNDGLLMRARLLKLGEQQFVFTLTMHHIIADGWSMGILVDELAQFYRSFIAGQASTLPALPIQYADFAHWEQQRLTGDRIQTHLDYWLTQLADAPTFLELPTDKPRPRVRSNKGQTEFFQLPPEVSDSLSRVCQVNGVTPYMALLAAFGVSLCRHTNQEDIVIGSPISVRPHEQTEGLIGLFLNTVALRIDLSGNPSFSDLLARVRTMALGAYEHSAMPFEQLLQALNLERRLDHTPLFQVLFALQNAPMGEVGLDGLSITPQATESLHAPFDLVLSVEETSDGLHGLFRYNTDLFDANTIQHMVSRFSVLLENLLAKPDTAIRHAALLSQTEQAQLSQWRGGEVDVVVSQTLHQLFSEQASAHPQAIALRYESHALSYADLERRANQVAHRLRELGIRNGQRVGLCCERSLEMIVGLLGILKAGGAYVPLDPSYPQDRLAYIVENADLSVIVTYTADVESIALAAISHQRKTVNLADASLAAQSEFTPTDYASPDQTAYVIYTSGSTGRPKGVEVSHANVARLFSASESLFGFGSQDVWTLFHSYAFDFSVWELWGGLLYGGEVVVVPYATSRSPELFLQLVRDAGVTVLNQTPSAFRQFIEADRRHEKKSYALKWIVFGGEALDPNALLPWVERYGLDTPQLINMYGITETTVHVTYKRLCQEDLVSGGSLIGLALPDLTLELRDPYQQLVPIGVAGEIQVGGGGVAKGYLKLPELTAERFTANADGQRIYHSGDAARWRTDGSLEYLGRIDQQVKIRGFRIELGEIENCLAKHPAVTSAVVDTREDAEGKRLFAYVVVEDAQKQNSSLLADIRQWLGTQLPEYMVPAMVLAVEQMPLTNNGKVDRKKLANIEIHAQSTTQQRCPPTTDLEKYLAGLYSDILGVNDVSIDDNFFALGGDSIRGVILINKLQEKIGHVIHVVALFEAPTIRELITYLGKEYPDAMRDWGVATSDSNTHEAPLDESSFAAFQQLIKPLPACGPYPNKNPRAIFVLSPPRSGSTLLRVLLGGHPALFSPPELELLGFESLGERARVCSGRDAMWLEGTLRAVMEAKQVDADTAKQIMADYEQQDMSVKDFYGELQSWLGGKYLVDKSPSYALDLATLQRAEAYFDEPLYIHLHRHPYGMISSFEEARLNQIFFRYPHDYSVRRLAEMIWLHSHRNIQSFLADIPQQRQLNVSFEDMTREPAYIAEQMCHFIGIDFASDMLDIYDAKRMTDGIHSESRMLGDVKFHQYNKIDASVADRWRTKYANDFLGEPSWSTAKSLGHTAAVTDNHGHLTLAPIKRDQAHYPLSFAQQRLWFLDQLEGMGAAYSMPVALRITGPINQQALATSFRMLSLRHEVLRSRFLLVDGEPVIAISPDPIELKLIDWKKQSGLDLRESLRAEAERGFDLQSDALMRCTLYQGEQHEQVLFLNLHHIVSDGWSMGILIQELSALYNIQLNASGEAAELPPLAIQYIDYSAWQHQYLQGPLLAKQLAYWRESLQGSPALLDLPTDFSRPPIQQYRGDTLDAQIDSELAARLKQIAEQNSVSLYMLMLAAFSTLLSRYSGQDDIVIGSPTANRGRAEVEPLIGFFVNTLVLRFPVDATQSFQDFLGTVRKVVLSAFAHQDVSFEQLVEELQPQRNLSYSPLFQVMFSMQNTPTAIPALAGLDVEEMPLAQQMSKYDLTLSISEADRDLKASFEFSTDLFERATIKRFAAHYHQLLASIVANVRQPLSQLELLDAKEQNLLTRTLNDTARKFDGPTTIHGLIECQASITPDAIAAVCGNDSLSYSQLNQDADTLAARLMSLGLKPGSTVALCVERSLDMLVSLLAILKADCAYVPLDPNYPAARVGYVLTHANVSLLLTHSSLRDTLPNELAPVVCLDTLDDTQAIAESLPQTSVTGEATADNPLAYVIYTSGSTGKPKGVMISHAAAVNFLHAMREQPGLTQTDSLLAVTTISFDIAVLELYLPLMVGGRVVIGDQSTTRDANALLRLIEKENITAMQATPATWRMLLAAGWGGQPQFKALCGGEALPTRLAKDLLARCESLWNLYGPTEATVWAAAHRVSDESLQRATVPIGKPIANYSMYILDANGNPQAKGLPGDLYIGGAGLAEGYLNRPDLTSERFIVSEQLGRLYWTGDKARHLSNGDIEFLGRDDQQVKVRGFRVELGEVEKVLSLHAGIDQCAVAIDGADSESARLVAYYTGTPIDQSTLRKALLNDLPDYMVPSLFVPLETMPLTPNGKVDRKALRVPENLQEGSAAHHQGFRDSIEQQLTQIWGDVLNVRAIGIHDNFFSLGGHSLLAVRLLAHIAQAFSQHLPLASLFKAPTIAEMAALLRDTNNTQAQWPAVVAIQSQGKKAPLFCAAGAGGNVVYFHELAQALGNERPFYGLQPPGLDGVTPPHQTVEDLARHYLASIQQEAGEKPALLAGHSFGGLVAFEMARRLCEHGTPPAGLIIIDSPAPHFFKPTGKDWTHAKWLSQVSEIVSHLYGVDAAVTENLLNELPEDDQLALVHQQLVTQGVLPEGTGVEYFKGFVDVYKANLSVDYQPDKLTADMPVLLLRSAQEQPQQLTSDQFADVRSTRALGWRDYIEAAIEVADVPGDHLTMMRAPNVATMARWIRDYFTV